MEDQPNEVTNGQQRRRRRPRNLPAELKVEIVDCLSVENAVHFLANVPSQLIINKCAPRVRRILKTIDQIATGYARTLLGPDYDNMDINLYYGLNYTPEMDIFLRYGAAHCRSLWIYGGDDDDDGLVGYPANFFNDLIKHYYETKVPTKAVPNLHINFSSENPAPWPGALVQPQAGEMNVEEVEVDNEEKCVKYIMRNKHNRNIAFKLDIDFHGGATCYHQMTAFFMEREKDVQSREA